MRYETERYALRKGQDMRRILVTGGSRGIGAEIVRRFAQGGDAVAFLYRSRREDAERVVGETGAAAIAADVSDPDAVRRAVAAAREALGGGIDVLVCNAGISRFTLSRDVSDCEWRQMLDTDLSGAFYLARDVQEDMIRKGKGRIINIGSMWGKVGASMEVAYSAAKAGVRGLTMALAKELGPSGITVNCVEPGVIATEMNAALTKEALEELTAETPLCRLGTPADVANAVYFLASEEAGFITGQCLGVDGGFAV